MRFRVTSLLAGLVLAMAVPAWGTNHGIATDSKLLSENDTNKEQQPSKTTEVVYVARDWDNPKFPGCDRALMEFLGENIIYPQSAINDSIQGRVVVQLLIMRDGSIGDVKVVRSVREDLDNEVVRVCRLLPKFRPVKQKGEAKEAWYTLPISFKLKSDD